MRTSRFRPDQPITRPHYAILAALLLACSASAADRLTVNSPLQPLYADLETAATFALPQPSERNWRLDISGALSASNRLTCSFGADANTNAVLDAEEITAVLSWEGGAWVVLGGPDLGTRYTAAPSGGALRLDIRFRKDGSISSAGLRDSGQPLAFDGPAAGLLDPKQWDIACLKARGFGERAEALQVAVYPDGTTIRIR